MVIFEREERSSCSDAIEGQTSLTNREEEKLRASVSGPKYATQNLIMKLWLVLQGLVWLVKQHGHMTSGLDLNLTPSFSSLGAATPFISSLAHPALHPTFHSPNPPLTYLPLLKSRRYPAQSPSIPGKID